jgi:hypothetical protein
MILLLLKYLIQQDYLYHIDHNCASSIADEGERESSIWEDFEIYPYINKHLHNNQADNTNPDQPAVFISNEW